MSDPTKLPQKVIDKIKAMGFCLDTHEKWRCSSDGFPDDKERVYWWAGYCRIFPRSNNIMRFLVTVGQTTGTYHIEVLAGIQNDKIHLPT